MKYGIGRFFKIKMLPLPPKLFFHQLFKTTKNTINAQLRIDGDFYPRAF
jgi:hypothetical protein